MNLGPRRKNKLRKARKIDKKRLEMTKSRQKPTPTNRAFDFLEVVSISFRAQLLTLCQVIFPSLYYVARVENDGRL